MLIAIPLLIVPVVIYNLVILLGGAGVDPLLGPSAVLDEVLFRVPMTSGASWSISIGELILFLSLILLFVELLKSTSSQRVAIVNHALSMALFVVCLVEFLLLPGFAGSVFFLILTMVLLDVLAGFIVTIIASRRDFDMNPR
ncbi:MULTISPECIES: hypothetical protein [unclassified Brevundimonas]|uniref:hypothetical protein n=1 Tax=unclassified Brevundimonas TaxID=2622653 RepID=UPI000CFBFBC8|nr:MULTISPECIES: hypothetical protein [unclassified Brevundimonas]PRA25882.1 hypothetical protein CQ024_13835 [Brevundimonas sp. MYb27]PQZ75444.1 hypothetical protein CQ026_14685 [Brevundimonas sp. MYb31]PRB11332.1 hypothetical protein CQ039_15530 [Brevundimonas sp. MYb52]PRB32568.1 hypothetical protein CQ035_15545 [Brevundimonas sp. MYb46]PRB41350.1 hypothetical protein CQ028_15535 [Brevundimonas sp. MYb33]